MHLLLSRLGLTVLILLILNSSISAQSSILLENVNLIDGTGTEMQSGKSILMRGSQIVKIFDYGDPVTEDNIERIDLSGKYVLPGLFDMHVHFATSPSNRDRLDLVKERLEVMLKNGVTGVRDMAGDVRQLVFLSRQSLLDEIKSPDLYFSTLMAGASFFDDPRTASSARGLVPGEVAWMKAITHETDIPQAIAEAKGSGAAGVKLYADLPGELVTKIIEEAKRQNFLVWSHASVIPAIPSDVVYAGINAVSHATLLAWETAQNRPESGKQRYNDTELQVDAPEFEALLAAMAKNQVYLDPTVAIYKGRYTPNVYNNGIKATKAAFDAGVPLIVGTDRGFNVRNFTQLPLINEMEALVNEAGIPPLEVIKAATLNAAKLLRIDERVGSVDAGKTANLVVLDANPLSDITNIKKVHSVYKNGKKVD